MKIITNLPPDFDITYDTIERVSVPDLELFEPIKTELWAQEVVEFSVMLYGKMSNGGHSLPTNIATA